MNDDARNLKFKGPSQTIKGKVEPRIRWAGDGKHSRTNKMMIRAGGERTAIRKREGKRVANKRNTKFSLAANAYANERDESICKRTRIEGEETKTKKKRETTKRESCNGNEIPSRQNGDHCLSTRQWWMVRPQGNESEKGREMKREKERESNKTTKRVCSLVSMQQLHTTQSVIWDCHQIKRQWRQTNWNIHSCLVANKNLFYLIDIDFKELSKSGQLNRKMHGNTGGETKALLRLKHTPRWGPGKGFEIKKRRQMRIVHRLEPIKSTVMNGWMDGKKMEKVKKCKINVMMVTKLRVTSVMFCMQTESLVDRRWRNRRKNVDI